MLRAGAVKFPNPQVDFVGIEAASAHVTIVLIGVVITYPLPDVASHVVETIGAGGIEGIITIVRLTIVKTHRRGITQLAIHLLDKIK